MVRDQFGVMVVLGLKPKVINLVLVEAMLFGNVEDMLDFLVNVFRFGRNG